MAATNYSVCALDCPDCCSIQVRVDDLGKATALRGDPHHPITQGFLCAKVARYLDREYHPERLLYPLRRSGPKGSASFERIPWDQALDEIATRLHAIAAQHGPESILPYSYGGTLGYLQGSGMDRRFFHRLGASQLNRTICATAGSAGLMQAYGARFGTEPEQFANAKLILAWGANVMGTNVHLWPFIQQAKRAGARFYVLDPIRNRTGQLADRFFPVFPGSDAALALSLIHVILSENLQDQDYLDQYAENLDALRQLAAQFPPERAATLTGIPATDIIELAREYATTRPAVIRINYGLQRSQWGATAVRLTALLPVLCGHWRYPGGGFQLSTSGAYEIDRHALERPDLMHKALQRPARTINMTLIGEALTQAQPPVHALFVYNSNPLDIAPDQARTLQGLQRDDLFTVVSEQFLTSTARFADIVLPATTFLENKDCYFAYGHYYLQYAEPALPAPGECRSNVELFRQLAARMGFDDPCLQDSEDDMIRQLLASGSPFLEGITIERLQRERFVRLNISEPGQPFLPFAQGGFRTPSGRVNLNVDFHYEPPVESRLGDPALTAKYPFELVTSKADDGMNSTFAHRPALAREATTATIHPADAARLGIADGQPVRLFNDRGDLRLTARIAEDGAVNRLSPTRLTDFGGGPTFYNCLVGVTPCDPLPSS
jgi:anaerobic selenocysteine-containing dehydrogenase